MRRKLNIIIIDGDINASKYFGEYIDTTKELYLIAVTNNSYQALDLVEKYVPDAIVLDLELNQGKGNGLTFLMELNSLLLPFKPFILVTTNNSSTVAYDCARQYGADFIMSKNQEDYSEQNVLEFLKMMKDSIHNNIFRQHPNHATIEPAARQERRIARIINTELNNIGISPKVIGYKYLTEAVQLVLNGQTKNLCGIIGQKYSKSDSSVERAMQNAINSAWRSSNVEEQLKYYTARIHSERGVPTMTEFVYYYAYKIKNELTA